MSVDEMIYAILTFNVFQNDIKEFGDHIMQEFYKLSPEDKEIFVDSMAGEQLYMLGYEN